MLKLASLIKDKIIAMKKQVHKKPRSNYVELLADKKKNQADFETGATDDENMETPVIKK